MTEDPAEVEFRNWWPARLDIDSDDNIHIIDGYLTAARILVEAVREQVTLSDELVYPIMYLYRHHLELKLKTIWECLRRIGRMNKSYPKHHGILDIWNACSNEVIQITGLSIKELSVVQICLEEFDRLDPKSESFRFHQRKDGLRIGQFLQYLQILPVAQQIDECVDILESVMLFLYHESDYAGLKPSEHKIESKDF